MNTRLKGRVENRFSPALPHQTVRALLTHTAFRCSSRQGMRICTTYVTSATEGVAPVLNHRARNSRRHLLGLGIELPL